MSKARDGVEDLCMIKKVDNNEICHHLKIRLAREEIYTNIGSVLVCCNPFKWLNIYGNEYVQLYSSATTANTAPHIYALADSAYRRMMSESTSQAVIISGESGAGKTEAAKGVLNFVSAVSGGGGDAERLKKVIHDTNPLLEGFGNAKTVSNVCSLVVTCSSNPPNFSTLHTLTSL